MVLKTTNVTKSYKVKFKRNAKKNSKLLTFFYELGAVPLDAILYNLIYFLLEI